MDLCDTQHMGDQATLVRGIRTVDPDWFPGRVEARHRKILAGCSAIEGKAGLDAGRGRPPLPRSASASARARFA